MGDIKPAYIETLREMQRYGYYPFRQATCRKLLALGLAEVVPEDVSKVRLGYRITPAGRAALRPAAKAPSHV